MPALPEVAFSGRRGANAGKDTSLPAPAGIYDRSPVRMTNKDSVARASSFPLIIYVVVAFAVSVVMAFTANFVPAVCLVTTSILAPTASGGARVALRRNFTVHTALSLLFATLTISFSYWLGGFFSFLVLGESISGYAWVTVGLILGFFFAK
jgi:hypothetical protein